MAWQLLIQSFTLLCHPSSYDQREPLTTPNTPNNQAVHGLPVSALISNTGMAKKKKNDLTVSFPYTQLFLHFSHFAEALPQIRAMLLRGR